MENKKVAVVTGAAKGIGQAIALKYLSLGYCVVIVDIDVKGISDMSQKLAAYSTDKYLIVEGDIIDKHFQKKVVEATIIKWGRIDVLINNAAWRTLESMRTIEKEIWDKTLEICLTAPAFLTQIVASVMESLQIPGVIIMVSSMMSERAAGYSPAYIAAKGGLDALVSELAITYGRSGIRVVGVSPGFIQTDMSTDYKDEEGNDLALQMGEYLIDATPLGRSGTAIEISEAVYWLSSNAASFITGTSLLLDGGFKHNLNSYSLKKQQLPKEF